MPRAYKTYKTRHATNLDGRRFRGYPLSHLSEPERAEIYARAAESRARALQAAHEQAGTISVTAAAQLLGHRSLGTVRYLQAAGKLPRPLTLAAVEQYQAERDRAKHGRARESRESVESVVKE